MSLQPADFRAHWERILPGLREALAHQREGLRAEDVYAALAQGSAQLYLAADGFVILRQELAPDSGRRSLFVWFGHCSGGAAIARYEAEILELARACGAGEVAFCSTRPGFERALPQAWQLQYRRWHRRVT